MILLMRQPLRLRFHDLKLAKNNYPRKYLDVIFEQPGPVDDIVRRRVADFLINLIFKSYLFESRHVDDAVAQNV